MWIKRCEINRITVDIEVENRISSKEKHSLELVKLLKILTKGHIDNLLKTMNPVINHS